MRFNFKMPTKYYVSRIMIVLIVCIVTFYLLLLKISTLAPLDDNYRNYLIDPGEQLCGRNKGENIFIMSFNPSAATNFDKRQAIRSTWTNKFYKENHQFKIVFIVGLSSDHTINTRVQLESYMYGDILQGNFVDTYKNLTYKTILGIKWMSEYCDNAKFILKIDDDMVVNTKSLSDYFLNLTENNTVRVNNSIYGLCKQTYPQRDKKSKWYTPISEYSDDIYPTYCIGSAYIFTSDLMKPMYNLTRYIKPFFLEDVYVGMLAKELNTNFNQIWQYWFHNPKKAINYTVITPSECFHFVLVSNLEKYYMVWNLITAKYLETTETICKTLYSHYF